jgi:hypothetical protein
VNGQEKSFLYDEIVNKLIIGNAILQLDCCKVCDPADQLEGNIIRKVNYK